MLGAQLAVGFGGKGIKLIEVIAKILLPPAGHLSLCHDGLEVPALHPTCSCLQGSNPNTQKGMGKPCHLSQSHWWFGGLFFNKDIAERGERERKILIFDIQQQQGLFSFP